MREYREIPVVDKGVITIVVTTSRNPTIGGCYIEDLYVCIAYIERRVSAYRHIICASQSSEVESSESTVPDELTTDRPVDATALARSRSRLSATRQRRTTHKSMQMQSQRRARSSAYSTLAT